MICLRRNCSDNNDYLTKAQLIGKKIEAKGYSREFINEKIQEVYQIPRNVLVRDKNKDGTTDHGLPLIMNYSVQHKQVERIIKKYWPLLKADKTLHNVLPDKPRFTYRRVPTLRALVAKNVLEPPKRVTELSFFQGKGFHPCRRCYACQNTNLMDKNVPILNRV